MKGTLSVCLLLSAMLCLASAAQAGVVNPSFEEPVGNQSYATTPFPGWSTSSAGDTWIDLGTTEDPAPDGDQYLSVKGNVWVTQVTDIQTEAGLTYTLNAYARGTASTLYMWVDGVLKASGSGDESDWTMISASFLCDAADAGKYIEVGVNGANGTSDWQNYDLVTVSVTPEPGTISLLVLGGLGVLVRRKR